MVARRAPSGQSGASDDAGAKRIRVYPRHGPELRGKGWQARDYPVKVSAQYSAAQGIGGRGHCVVRGNVVMRAKGLCFSRTIRTGAGGKGASEGMSKTCDGIILNLMDTWTRVQVMVMDAGVFDSMKEKLQAFLTLVKQMAADGRLQAWADALATRILAAIDAVWTLGKAMVETWQAVFPWLEAGATAVGGWENFIKIVAGGAVVSKVLGLGNALTFIGKTIKVISMALMANPILAVIAAIAVAANLIYDNWGAISAWFVQLWDSVSGAFRRGWAWIKQVIDQITPAPIKAAWSILTACYDTLWQAIKGYFQGFATFVSGIFTGDMLRAVSGLRQMWDAVKLALSAVFTAIGSALEAVWTTVIKPVTDKLGMTDAIVSGWTALKEGLAAVLDWVGAKFEWLAGIINPVIDGLRWVKDSGAFGAGPIIVGERGPELRYESRGGFIAHNNALREMARLSAIVAGTGFAGAGMADIPAPLAARAQTFSPSYSISLTAGAGHGSPADLEAMIRRVLTEQAARAEVDQRRRLHD